MGSGIFVKDMCKYRAQLGSMQGQMWPHACLSCLNKRSISTGQQKDLDLGSGVVFRGFNKRRIQFGSIQGHRCALRNVVAVMNKGGTQCDSVHGRRGGPRSIFWKLEQQMCTGECAGSQCEESRP